MNSTEDRDNTCMAAVVVEPGSRPASGLAPVGMAVDDELDRNDAPSESSGANGLIELDDPAPCSGPVDGAALLQEIVDLIRTHVFASVESVTAMVLWVVYTYVYDAFNVSPILCFGSPERRCGKTTALTFVGGLARKSLAASNVSSSGLYRVIADRAPTLLIDEADTFLKANPALRGILNAGHTRETAKVIRGTGPNHAAWCYGTWCPKAVALIGTLPSTLEDRSIMVRMRRKAPAETVRRFSPVRDRGMLEPIRSRIARWAIDNARRLTTSAPTVPETLHDRAADNWMPLLAIADLAGGDWPKAARRAAIALSPNEADDENLSVTLLKDIRAAFHAAGRPHLFTPDLIARLVAMDESPWRTMRGGNRLDPHLLSSFLRPYGIAPKLLRVGGRVSRGYDIDDCRDAFQRYLPADRYTVTPAGDAVPDQRQNGDHRPPSVTGAVESATGIGPGCNIVTVGGNVSGGGVTGANISDGHCATSGITAAPPATIEPTAKDDNQRRSPKGGVAEFSARGLNGDPASMLVTIVAALKKAALQVKSLTPEQAGKAANLAEDINTIGFVLTQLVPVLVRTGDENAIELVRKTIAALVIIPLDPEDPEPDGPSRKGSVRDDAAPAESGAGNLAAETAVATSAPCLDASKLEWPTGPGLKVVFPAQVMKAAVRRASLAALTHEGQRDIQRVIGTTESCVKIAATDDGVTFESAIPRFKCRHVLSASDGAVVVEQGEVCVSAKQLKSICTKLAKEADTITVSFVPARHGPDESRPEGSVEVEHHGAAEIGAVRGNAIVDKAPIASHQPDEYMSAEYDSTDAAKVIVAAKAGSLRKVCRLAATAINPYDLNETKNKVAIFDGGDTVYFVGMDGRRLAIVPAKKSSFEKSSEFNEYDECYRTAADGSTVMDKRPIPVLVDAEYLGPILAAAANDDSVTIATDEAGDYVYVSGGASCYRISRLNTDSARRYTDYRKPLSLPMRAAILVDRQECRTALETLHQVDRDRLHCTFSHQDGTVTLSAPPESQESLNGGLAYSITGRPAKTCSRSRRSASTPPTSETPSTVWSRIRSRYPSIAMKGRSGSRTKPTRSSCTSCR